LATTSEDHHTAPGAREADPGSSESRFRAFFHHSGDGILIADAETRRFLEANERICQMLGYSRDELRELTVDDIHPKEALPSVLEKFRQQAEGRLTVAPDIPMLRRDGSAFMADISSMPVEINGRTHLVGTIREIGYRHRAEQALRDAELRYRTLFEQSPDAILILDPDSLRAIEFNDGMPALLGHTREEFAALEISDYEAVLGPEEIRARVEEILREGSAVFESAVRKKDGSIAQVVVRIRAVHLGGRQVLHAIVRDVSERRRLEKQLLHSQKLEAIGQLAGGIAHDFNNVLTAIIGYSNLLGLKLGGGHPGAGYLEKILSAAERAAQLTRGLLLFSRKQKLARKPTGVNQIVQLVDGLLQRLIGEHIEVRTRLAKPDLAVMADGSQIEQVLMNLATNARDAMPRGGTLEIRSELSRIDEDFVAAHGFGEIGEYALITVADSGLGMDPSVAERVFEPFFTTKDVGKGTGLGLAIGYGIVKEHSGYITVESEPGEGTVFRIFLPMLRNPDGTPMLFDPSPPPRGTETLLVAEDDDSVRSILQSVLEGNGYTVVPARDGREAFHLFIEHDRRIDLVVLDMRMPKLSGHEVCDRIRDFRPDMKALFLTDYAEELPGNSHGCVDGALSITKPVSSAELLVKVRQLLDG
jgi:PAS domain S-box-containing protein